MNQRYSSYEEMEASHKTQDHLAGEVLKNPDASAEARANAIAEIQERTMERQLYKYNEDKQTKFRAHHIWRQFFETHSDLADNSANRSLLLQAFDVRHGKTGKLIGSVEPDLEGLEAALEKYRNQLSRVEVEAPSAPEPELTPLEKVEQYNAALRAATPETLYAVGRIRAALSIGLQPSQPEWAQRRLPTITQEIRFLLSPPESINAVRFQSVPQAPQLSQAETELGEHLKAKGIEISSDRPAIIRWLRSEADNDMASVRKFLRDSNGRIDRANESVLQAVLSGRK